MKSILEVSEIGYLTWWNFPRRAWLIIITELGIIATLSGLLYSTYLNNVYFQTYVDSLSPVLVPALSVAFGISSAAIATYLYLGMKRIRTYQDPGIPVRKKAQSRRTTKKPPQPEISPPKIADLSPSTTAKLKPIAPSQRHAQPHKSPLKESEDHGSTHSNTEGM